MTFKRKEAIEYDMMDVSSEGFASDYYEFRQEIKELERRLSSLLVQAFDDAACMQARFNLLDSFKALTLIHWKMLLLMIQKYSMT